MKMTVSISKSKTLLKANLPLVAEDSHLASLLRIPSNLANLYLASLKTNLPLVAVDSHLAS